MYQQNKFDETKMFPNMRALAELKRLNNISKNQNPTDWEKEDGGALKIYSLNCRSLNRHYLDIAADDILLKSDIIILQDNDTADNFSIPGFELHLNSYGRGKGLAIFYKRILFAHYGDLREEQLQISKMCG